MGARLSEEAAIEIERVDRLEEADARAVSALIQRTATHQRHAPLGEDTFARLRNGDPDAFALIVRDGGGIAAYAHATRFRAHGSLPARLAAELAVDPSRRRQGIGRRLLAGIVEEARSTGAARVDVWGHHQEAPCAALTRAFGMVPTRALLRLSLRLETLPDRLRSDPLPAGVTMRQLRHPDDDDALVELIRRAFPDHPENATWTRDDFDERAVQAWFDPSAVLLADGGGRLLGVHWMKFDPEAPGAEVYMLGVAPETQGHGLGRTLLLEGLAEMRRRGTGLAYLYVDADNEAAIHLYGEAGFRREHVDTCFSLDVARAPGGPHG